MNSTYQTIKLHHGPIMITYNGRTIGTAWTPSGAQHLITVHRANHPSLRAV